MSLATRCTACGTVFRIVEDQLRVSDGWVRCGRCAEIFDARELLFDIERDAPPPWPPQFAPEPQPAPALPPEPVPTPPAAPSTSTAADLEAPHHWMQPPEPEPHVDELPTGWPPAPDMARREPRWVDEAAPPPPPVSANVAEPELAATPAAAPAPVVVPEFMRQAERSARWSRSGLRRVLAGASLVLALLLVAQAGLHFRDTLAARHPSLRPVLTALCGVAGCEIKPLQDIEALVIDATSLSPVSAGVYKLSVVFSSKASLDVAAPAVDLILLDSSGKTLSRRVLGPETMTPALTQVAAESEQTLTLVFSTGEQRVSGYKVALFYP